MKKDSINFVFVEKILTFAVPKEISRSGAVVARWAHNPKVVSSSLASATKKKVSGPSDTFFFLMFVILKKTSYFCIRFRKFKEIGLVVQWIEWKFPKL